MIDWCVLWLLTVDVFLLRWTDLFGRRLADGLGEALAGDAVLGGHHPVDEALPGDIRSVDQLVDVHCFCDDESLQFNDDSMNNLSRRIINMNISLILLLLLLLLLRLLLLRLMMVIMMLRRQLRIDRLRSASSDAAAAVAFQMKSLVSPQYKKAHTFWAFWRLLLLRLRSIIFSIKCTLTIMPRTRYYYFS